MARRALGLSFAHVALLCLTLLAPGLPAVAQTGDLARAVKATYLYKFVPFVDWPPTAFASAEQPFTLCIVGDDPFGPLLDSAIAGQHVGDRPLVLRRFSVAERLPACHILFAAGSSTLAVARILEAVRGGPALTITDSQTDPRAKGMINFVVLDNRIRFEIDNRAAQQQGLAISSKLLSLAVVRPRV